MVKPWIATLLLTVAAAASAGEEDYYRLVDIMTSRTTMSVRDSNWKPGGDVVLETTGIELLDDDRIAVSTRKGEVWILSGVYADPPANVRYSLFATALHEPLGLLKKGDALLTVQRTELTSLRDTDGDGAADEYLTVAKGWNVSGNYHEYAFGPKADGDGNLWLTLNIGIGDRVDNSQPWRGWGIRVAPDGTWTPECAGMRSPCGLGANASGDMFYTDQQGNWVPACSLHHLRRGAFYGNAQALQPLSAPGSPVRLSAAIPGGLPYPQALEKLPELKPPAVWFPFQKAGESSTDVVLDTSGGKFGPFANQLFVGDFTTARITRVYLEKVDGEYQGACFPFRRGFASAVVRMAFGRDGSMFAGLTNRGWTSLGPATYGLQRLVWTGKTPFEIKEMKATPAGFDLVFTRPADRASAADPSSYALNAFTYLYHEKYGSPEIDAKPLKVLSAAVSSDGMSVRLTVDSLRKGYVHELRAAGVRDADGEPLLHSAAYYTLNAVPRGK